MARSQAAASGSAQACGKQQIAPRRVAGSRRQPPNQQHRSPAAPHQTIGPRGTAPPADGRVTQQTASTLQRRAAGPTTPKPQLSARTVVQAPEQARSSQLQLTPCIWWPAGASSGLNTLLGPSTHASSASLLPLCLSFGLSSFLSHPCLNDDARHVALSVAPAHALNGQHLALERRELAAAPHTVLRLGSCS